MGKRKKMRGSAGFSRLARLERLSFDVSSWNLQSTFSAHSSATLDTIRQSTLGSRHIFASGMHAKGVQSHKTNARTAG